MKTLIISALTLASVSAFAIDGSLDGSKFCRSVPTGGMFGQPAGVRSHCISFQGGRATDNANTFFGNPPETFTYDVVGGKIMNVDQNKPTGYVLRNHTLVNSQGAVLTITK